MQLTNTKIKEKSAKIQNTLNKINTPLHTHFLSLTLKNL